MPISVKTWTIEPPARKNSATVVATMIAAVPVSGSIRISAATTPTAKMKGTKPEAKLLRSRRWEASQAEI